MKSVMATAENVIAQPDFQKENLLSIFDKIRFCNEKTVNLARRLQDENNDLRLKNDKLVTKVRMLHSA